MYLYANETGGINVQSVACKPAVLVLYVREWCTVVWLRQMKGELAYLRLVLKITDGIAFRVKKFDLWYRTYIIIQRSCRLRPLRQADQSFRRVLARARARVCVCVCVWACTCLISCDLETSTIRNSRPELVWYTTEQKCFQAVCTCCFVYDILEVRYSDGSEKGKVTGRRWNIRQLTKVIIYGWILITFVFAESRYDGNLVNRARDDFGWKFRT